MKTVTIQDGVESLENMTFYGCLVLKEVTMPDSIKNIGDQNISMHVPASET